MAVGSIVRYHQFAKLLAQSASPQWDDPAAGAYMWVLAQASFNASIISGNMTYASLATSALTTGAGAPINVAGRQIIDSLTEVGRVELKASSANFGAVPQAVKYLVCVQPVTAGVIDNNAKLCFYVDLNTTSNVSELAANTDINVVFPNETIGVLG